MLLRKLFKCFLPVLILFSSPLSGQDCPDEGLRPSIIQFNLNSCVAKDRNGSAADYSELVGLSSNKSDCATINVIGHSGSLYRNNPSENLHSCTPGIDDTAGICVSSETSCSFRRDSDLAIRFDVEVVPGVEPAQLHTLTFYEKAPINYDWIDGDTGGNNYPTKYGVRITSDGREVFRSTDLPTGNDWSLQTIDLSFFSGLVVEQPTIFTIELLAYCPIGNGKRLSLWDIDHLRLYAGCISAINGGMLSVDDGAFETTTCTGDGINDNIDPTLKFSKGDSERWLITDEDGVILDLPTDTPFQFENAGEGVCLIWNISYEGNLGGVAIGANANDITGCFDLSNPITVNREGVLSSSIFFENGEEESSEITLCTNDGIDDMVMVGSRTGSGTTAIRDWVITDQSGVIINANANPPFNFEGADEGTCLVWLVNYRDGLIGKEEGENIADLSGCFLVSNSLTVIRNQPLAGTIEFNSTLDDEIEICAGDGLSDEIRFRLDGDQGAESYWVVTSSRGRILFVSDRLDYDFENGDLVTNEVIHISSYEELQGLEVDNNLDDVIGCFTMSNTLTVTRNNIDAGSITTTDGLTETGVCVELGQSNLVDVDLDDSNTRANSAWLITNTSGEILDLPSRPPFDFSGAEGGVQLIWHLSYGEISGLEVGESANDLAGCFELSNPITVNIGKSVGGTITGGPYLFCVGDGDANFIPQGDISLGGASGSNSQWIITDDRGEILGLPNLPSDVNFDDAPEGTCLVWHLSYEDGIEGLEIGNDALRDLEGCFGLSNSIEVTRTSVSGGDLEGGPFSFCIGDGLIDTIVREELQLFRWKGANRIWFITDIDGNILNTPVRPGLVDFDDAPAGTCLVWHGSYEGDIVGIDVGDNVNDITGCFDLSNPITINRGGASDIALEGGPFSFCIGDGQADMISASDLSITTVSGNGAQWIVTDANGEILGLPASPSDVNFDDVAEGTCFIYYVNFADDITGLEVGQDIDNLDGCFSLSDAVTVNRSVANGGELVGGPFSFCIGDGIADVISSDDISLFGREGDSRNWLVTDEAGNILEIPTDPSEVNFDDAPAGVCLLWHLSYSGEIEGLTVGANANDIVGCSDLSNPITIIRGGASDIVLEGGPFSFCVGDGVADMLSADDLSVTTPSGAGAQWVITDADGSIVGLPASPTEVNFDDVAEGTCLIYFVSFSGDLTGLELESNINTDLEGCFSISNSVTVDRGSANGGELTGGPFTFCIGDGMDDFIADDDIRLVGSDGDSRRWIVTDESGTILGLPVRPSLVNFEEAGSGSCLIWHLGFSGEIEGLEVGLNALDLNGCYSLSNPISVFRINPEGGTLAGGPFSFCVGDGVADNINDGELSITGNAGSNLQWIVTDAAGEILGLPENISDVDFDIAGVGTCLVWYLSYEGDIANLEVGLNANDLQGCFGLSNSVSVTRSQVAGGSISGGPFTFCVGDSIADNITNGEIVLVDNSGTNSQWLVTDTLGNILGLPDSPSDVNFDDASVGVCLVWHLSYEDGLVGLAVGESAGNLQGCFALTNSISVTRNQPIGGAISGGPFEFCVGDSIADNVAVTLLGESGSNSQWVVTDDQGNILDLPADIANVDFDDAPAGVCLIWHLSFEEGLTGAAVGNNASNLQGCFSLSNSITVTRKTGVDCLPPCEVVGGQLSGGPFTFCVGDEIRDTIPAGAITLDSAAGPNLQWVVTDSEGNILGLPADISDVDFDVAGVGECLIWNLTFEDGLTGAAVGNNASQLEGCFQLSNSISVTRSRPQGGTLAPDSFAFCVGDGVADSIMMGELTLSDAVGSNIQWVVTDIAGTILELPTNITDVNFDNAPAGECLVWSLSFEDGLMGATVGSNANDLAGCFSLSNPVTITRNNPQGGTLTGGPFTFCVGDSIADNIPMGSISLAGNSGDSTQWIVTDTLGNILGLPGMPSDVNFEDAPAGACLVWNLSYSGTLSGLEVGLNAGDIAGCFGLSNAITVNRNSGDDCIDPCDIASSAIAGGPFTFCVGDSIADNIPAGSISLTVDSLANTQWVVTDAQGNILGLPSMPSDVNFDEAGVGTCLIWNIVFIDSTTVFTVGANANNLGGCYALSNSISVTRNQPLGGTLTGGPFTFCVGDSIADNIPVDGITLSGNTGNSQWVVTDTLGNILGLPASPSDVNFDDAGTGVCLVWHLSFVDSLIGASVGMNAADIVGCSNLSNPIMVNRNQPMGGMISGGPFEFCVGDSIADMIPAGAITLTGNQGTNSQWVVTDDLGTIIGLPASPSDVNFESAEEGICFLWHLSFEDGLIGAEIDSSASSLQGCFSLSNSIEVVRNSGEDCDAPCDAVAGTLTGGPFSFCVGDSIPDNLPSGSVTLSVMDTTLSTRWLITDEQGIIIGLPNAPTDVNFDDAGVGTCLIWNASFQDSTTVFALGSNANTLGGCYALSNSISVIRTQPIGGVIEGGPFTFCVGDSIADNIPVDSISLTGQSGTNSQWVITDDSGMILGLPASPSDVDFDDAGSGTCLIWHLSFEDGLQGAAVGMSADSLVGCFSLSNSIAVNRVQPDGGMLSGGPFEFCVGDSIADFITTGSITLSGNTMTSNSQWVVTDTLGIILGLPANYEDVNFEDAPAGTCLVWHLSFDGPLDGGMIGLSADSLSGCFDLSNPITVNRVSGMDCPTVECNVEGGMIVGGPFEFCVGDGITDSIPAGAIVLDTMIGETFQWVVTDSTGVILGLPEDPSSVNFDIAPAGTCVIQHLSAMGELGSLAIGNNLVTDVTGCFDLSNGIIITRRTGDDCPSCDALGGRLISGIFEFCVGDGQDDFIDSTSIVLTENVGSLTQWIVTDTSGAILGLPAGPQVIDFGIVDPGTYLLRVVSYEEGLENLRVGNNISRLSGCFGISEPSTVNVIDPRGGTLIGGPFSFCVGDGVADMIMDSVTIAGATGESNRWVITDRDQNIIGLPGDLGTVDFDNAGVDTCLLWNISFTGELEGLIQDSLSLSDISGCFGISNSISVNRVGGDDCLAIIGIPVINEVTDDDRVEILNIGNSPIDVGEYWLCNRPFYDRINSLTIECGGDDYIINPGEVLTVVLDAISVAGQDGEIGLYKSNLFANPTAIADYVEWGSTGHGRSSVAVQAGIWTADDFVPSFNLGSSISYDGEGNASSDWTETTPNLCAENSLVAAPEEKLSILVFPSPANSEINFELNHDINEIHKVSIYDNYGHTLYSTDMNADDDFKLDVTNYKSGIYYLKVKTGRYSGVQRFIIVN